MRVVLAVIMLVLSARASYAAPAAEFYTIPTPLAFPIAIAADRKGEIWFLESDSNKLGRFRPETGTFSEYEIPTVKSIPVDVAVDSKGMVWFLEQDANQVGVFNPARGTFAEYEVPTPKSQPYKLALDKKGRVWFTEFSAGKIGVFDPSTKKFREYAIRARLVHGVLGWKDRGLRPFHQKVQGIRHPSKVEPAHRDRRGLKRRGLVHRIGHKQDSRSKPRYRRR